jgi:hypothetical protein
VVRGSWLSVGSMRASSLTKTRLKERPSEHVVGHHETARERASRNDRSLPRIGRPMNRFPFLCGEVKAVPFGDIAKREHRCACSHIT